MNASGAINQTNTPLSKAQALMLVDSKAAVTKNTPMDLVPS